MSELEQAMQDAMEGGETPLTATAMRQMWGELKDEHAFSDLMPCSRCGAHRWTQRDSQDGRIHWLLMRDRVRCQECNHHARCRDVAYPALVGRG